MDRTSLEKVLEGEELKDWKQKCDVMGKICELSKKNPQALVPHLKKMIFRISAWVEDLRSQVAGEAIACFHALFTNLKSKMVVNKAYFPLVRRAAIGDKGFLAQQSLKAIEAAIDQVSSRRVALLFVRHSNALSKGAAYKSTVAGCISRAVNNLTEEKGEGEGWPFSIKDTITLIPLVSTFLTDGSPGVRMHAKAITRKMDIHIGTERLLACSLRAHSTIEKHDEFVRNYFKLCPEARKKAKNITSNLSKRGKIDTPRPHKSRPPISKNASARKLSSPRSSTSSTGTSKSWLSRSSALQTIKSPVHGSFSSIKSPTRGSRSLSEGFRSVAPRSKNNNRPGTSRGSTDSTRSARLSKTLSRLSSPKHRREKYVSKTPRYKSKTYSVKSSAAKKRPATARAASRTLSRNPAAPSPRRTPGKKRIRSVTRKGGWITRGSLLDFNKADVTENSNPNPALNQTLDPSTLQKALKGGILKNHKKSDMSPKKDALATTLGPDVLKKMGMKAPRPPRRPPSADLMDCQPSAWEKVSNFYEEYLSQVFLHACKGSQVFE
ncbi:hypothetical protein AAMO2058_001406100 [Amorphochlora amoebiformis]